ncbi:MAG: sensor histidine kinase [Rufibacter sp.]
MKSQLTNLRKYQWGLSFGFWLLVAGLFIFHRMVYSLLEHRPVNWHVNGTYYLSVYLVWGGLTIPFVNWLNKCHTPKRISKIIFLAIGAAFLHSCLTMVLLNLVIFLSPQETVEAMPAYARYVERSFLPFTLGSLLTASLIVLGWFSYTILLRYQEQREQAGLLQSQLATTQLQMLRMQLQPHFIFNSFNTVSMMVRTGKNQEATDMLAHLAEFMRQTVYKGTQQMVTVREEMELCRQYLEIERIRFKDRLQLAIEMEENTATLLIPHMILQPLVENAFKHGLMETIGNRSLLQIVSKLEDGALKLAVQNTGALQQAAAGSSGGIGLENVRQRLHLVYGERAYFTLRQAEGMVEAQITIAL